MHPGTSPPPAKRARMGGPPAPPPPPPRDPLHAIEDILRAWRARPAVDWVRFGAMCTGLTRSLTGRDALWVYLSKEVHRNGLLQLLPCGRAHSGELLCMLLPSALPQGVAAPYAELCGVLFGRGNFIAYYVTDWLVETHARTTTEAEEFMRECAAAIDARRAGWRYLHLILPHFVSRAPVHAGVTGPRARRVAAAAWYKAALWRAAERDDSVVRNFTEKNMSALHAWGVRPLGPCLREHVRADAHHAELLARCFASGHIRDGQLFERVITAEHARWPGDRADFYTALVWQGQRISRALPYCEAMEFWAESIAGHPEREAFRAHFAHSRGWRQSAAVISGWGDKKREEFELCTHWSVWHNGEAARDGTRRITPPRLAVLAAMAVGVDVVRVIGCGLPGAERAAAKRRFVETRVPSGGRMREVISRYALLA